VGEDEVLERARLTWSGCLSRELCDNHDLRVAFRLRDRLDLTG